MSGSTTGAVPRIAPKARLEWDEVGQRYVLLYPEGLVALNSTATDVLRLCDGERAVGQIVAALKLRYRAGDIEPEVTAFLNSLAAKGLVTFHR
jgi:pyrroloquinoline quinone biosynthesis protein D